MNMDVETKRDAVIVLVEALERAEAAEVEIEEVHRYLDECYVNDPDEGRAVPLIDRVVHLTSRWAKADGEAERLREDVRILRGTLGLAERYVAKAHADGAYNNTAMSGERALRIIDEALVDKRGQDAAGDDQ
jgi:hypothetical protein